MNLCDATKRGAVELFLHGLHFHFPMPARDIVGIPGGFIGMPRPNDDPLAAIWIHELEHIASLKHAIGMFFTAIGYRAVQLSHSMQHGHLLLHTEGVPEPQGHELIDLLAQDHLRLKLIQSALSVEGFAMRVRTVVELMQPLLEGLALLSEMEYADGSPFSSWRIVEELEVCHYVRQHSFYSDTMGLGFGDEDGNPDMLRIHEYLKEQLRASRNYRRHRDDLLAKMFLCLSDDTEPLATSPYFYGYLYLRRFVQRCCSMMQGDPATAYTSALRLACKFVCEIIPMSLVHLFRASERSGKTDATEIEQLFSTMLSAGLAIECQEFPFFKEDKPPAYWNVDSAQFDWLPDLIEHSPEYSDEQLLSARVPAYLLHRLFDSNDRCQTAWRNDLAENLIRTERAKSLIPTARRRVLVAGVDEEKKIAFLAEPARAKAEYDGDKLKQVAFDVTGATFFKFSDPNTFIEFVKCIDPSGQKLQRFSMGAVPFGWNSWLWEPHVELETFVWLWPEGPPGFLRPAAQYFHAIEVVQRLRIENEEAGDPVFFLSGHNDPQFIEDRFILDTVMMKAFQSALDLNYTAPRSILAELAQLAPPDGQGLSQVAAQEWLDYGTGDTLGDVQDRCRKIYCRLLFPALGSNLEPVMSERKLEVLAPALARADMKRLRLWLPYGLVLDPALGYDAGQSSEPAEVIRATVERVREAAKPKLGIPLVAWHESAPHVRLDLIP